MQCKFSKKDGTQCRGIILLEDGFCMVHSPTAREAKGRVTKEKLEIARKFKLPSQKPFKQIRKFCVECCENWKTTMFCASVDCDLWYLRFGMLPKAFVRERGKKYAQLFDKKNFKHGRRYDPDIEIEEMEL